MRKRLFGIFAVLSSVIACSLFGAAALAADDYSVLLNIKFQDLNGASWNFDQYDDLEEFYVTSTEGIPSSDWGAKMSCFYYGGSDCASLSDNTSYNYAWSNGATGSGKMEDSGDFSIIPSNTGASNSVDLKIDHIALNEIISFPRIHGNVFSMPIINGSESALTLGYESVSSLPQDSEGRYIVDVVFRKAPEATKINVEFIGPEGNPWEIYYLHHIDATLQLDEGTAFASYVYRDGSERVFSSARRGYHLIDANTESRVGYMERVDAGTHGSIKRQLMRQQAADIIESIRQSYEEEPADDFEWGTGGCESLTGWNCFIALHALEGKTYGELKALAKKANYMRGDTGFTFNIYNNDDSFRISAAVVSGRFGKYELYDAAGNLVEDEWMNVVKGGEYTLKLYTPPVNTGSLGFYAAGNDSVLESMDFVYHGYFEFACYGTNIDFKSVYWTVEGEDEKHYELPESAETCYDGDQKVEGYGVDDHAYVIEVPIGKKITFHNAPRQAMYHMALGFPAKETTDTYPTKYRTNPSEEIENRSIISLNGEDYRGGIYTWSQLLISFKNVDSIGPSGSFMPDGWEIDYYLARKSAEFTFSKEVTGEAAENDSEKSFPFRITMRDGLDSSPITGPLAYKVYGSEVRDETTNLDENGQAVVYLKPTETIKVGKTMQVNDMYSFLKNDHDSFSYQFGGHLNNEQLEEFMQRGDVYISDFGMVPYGAKVTIEEIDEDYEPTVLVTENGSTQEMPECGSIEFEATGFLAGFDRHSEATLDEYNARIGKTIQFVNDHKVEKKSETPETPDTGDKIVKTVTVLMVAVSACAFVMWRIKRRA